MIPDRPVSAVGSGSPPAQKPEPCSQSAWSAAAADTPAAAGSAHWSSGKQKWCCGASPAGRTPEEQEGTCLRAGTGRMVTPTWLFFSESEATPCHFSSLAQSHSCSSHPPFGAGKSSALLCRLTGLTAAHLSDEETYRM